MLAKCLRTVWPKVSFAPSLDDDWPIPDAKSKAVSQPQEAKKSRRIHEGKTSGMPVQAGPRKDGLYVVTVNYQNEDAIEKLVQSLEQCDNIEKLIVVDHSPLPKLKLRETSFPIEMIQQPNRGYGAGINRGLQAIDTPDAVALVCNPDIEVMTPQTLAEAVRALKDNPHWGCLIPAQVDGDSNTIPVCRRFYTWKSLIKSRIWFMRRNPHIYRREHFYLERDLTQDFDVDWGNASSMFLKLSLFPYPICFDERFFLYFEDVDICAQMHVHGLSVHYYPRVVFRHYEQRQSHRDLFFLAMHVKSLLHFLVKYRGLPQAVDLRGKKATPLTECSRDE